MRCPEEIVKEAGFGKAIKKLWEHTQNLPASIAHGRYNISRSFNPNVGRIGRKVHRGMAKMYGRDVLKGLVIPGGVAAVYGLGAVGVGKILRDNKNKKKNVKKNK